MAVARSVQIALSEINDNIPEHTRRKKETSATNSLLVHECTIHTLYFGNTRPTMEYPGRLSSGTETDF